MPPRRLLTTKGIKMNKEFLTFGAQSSEEGMTTAEYAVGTVGATGIASILLWLSKQDWFKDLIADFFKSIFRL